MSLRSIATVVVVCAWFCEGCSTHRYEPAHPRTVHFPGLEATVGRTSMSLDGRGQLSEESVLVRTNAAAGTRLRQAGMVRFAEPACGGWWQADGIVVDDGSTDYDEEISGPHELRLTFAPGTAKALEEEPSAIELQLVGAGPHRCVRVPLPPAEDWTVLDAWSWGMRIDFAHLSTSLFPDAFNGLGFSVEFGRWLGPVKLSFAPGLLAEACDNESRCEKRSDGESGEIVAFAGRLDLAAYPIQYGIMAGGLVARWEQAYVTIPTVRGPSSGYWQGFQGGVRVGVFDFERSQHPYPTSPTHGALELEGSAGPVEVGVGDQRATEVKYGVSVLISQSL